ncbi:glycogen/starch/alpha-glucan phosphorylase [Thiococcus pfennigii]|jgi:starch phosphorylase|uniref:glycogen/starch/alpha-glucan phosphorylase n=1 Tax=Thiococcus pfennigii TaxID=1057 RepID=UPI001907C264|nr:glycogen/starch/alpha-glucan phosphorylase [Thiococcus pfennigii]MBK1700471.1 glycogen phosphorylase [Thiococcus pfennigii]MBK1732642.1 glycogen phosphorylase [Thiococcus pfennigii]
MSPFLDLTKSQPNERLFDLPPLAMDSAGLAEDFKRYYAYTLGRDRDSRSAYYTYLALAIVLRDRMAERWKRTRQAQDQANSKRTYYLSLEFLMGRALGNAMLNLGLRDAVERGLLDLGLLLEEVADNESDAGLGNGGLGRLAACFLDSCATLQLPVKGYGLRYEYGMFRQLIENGYQVEEPDHWMREGNPWELERQEYTQRIQFGGRTEFYRDGDGRTRARWVDTQDVLAVPYDTPIPGYLNDTINTLRLWRAAATDEFDLREFNAGSYPESVAQKNNAEHITMVLYPNDASECGKELRLRQQYFLASASIKDVIREWTGLNGSDFSTFADKNCFQLNDTHPAISVAELMRQLLDEHGLEWDSAWSITTRTMAYTNHTLLPEALERWPVRLFENLLPRLLEIIYEINARFLSEVAARWPGDLGRQQRMSLIEEGGEPQVRMAFLAIVGSFSVNGVAELHSRLLRGGLFRDFYELWPAKFNNKTNGVTPRRWLAQCNPALRDLLNDEIGDGWIHRLDGLARLVPYAEDPTFRKRWQAIKQGNKQRLADLVQEECGVDFPIEALFDVQVKRIHEYKRQLLNVLHVIHLYLRIKQGDTEDWTPRCVLIGGKAAPGYTMAKSIIKLINNVANVVNADPATEGRLRLAFIPGYRVSLMEVIAPGTDLSEQISTAGKEASGTGNMKFMMNGAITIGTLDGANIEIREQVGDENFFLFGLTAEEVEGLRSHYDPGAIIASDPQLRDVMHLLESGHFNQFEPGIFDAIIHSIRSPQDPWMTAADFPGYVRAQEQAARAYRDQERWLRMSILNCAHSGRFSSDRTIAEYNRDVWRMEPVAPAPIGAFGGA